MNRPLRPSAQPRTPSLTAIAAILAEHKAEILDELAEMLAEMAPGDGEEPLLDRAGLAERLGCSVGTVDREVGRGMPFVHVGDHKRFSWPDVLAWLRAREEQANANAAGAAAVADAAAGGDAA